MQEMATSLGYAAGTFLIAPYNVDLEEEGKGRRYF